MASKVNVEYVVNPPKNPVTQSNRISFGELLLSSNVATNPIRRQPIIFTAIVWYVLSTARMGKCCNRYRERHPKAPPAATIRQSARLTGIVMNLVSSLELFEETHIVLREHAEVLDLILKVGDTLHTHAQRKA